MVIVLYDFGPQKHIEILHMSKFCGDFLSFSPPSPSKFEKVSSFGNKHDDWVDIFRVLTQAYSIPGLNSPKTSILFFLIRNSIKHKDKLKKFLKIKV